MKEILKESVKLFGRTVIINVLCIIVVVSFIALSVALFAESAGYVGYPTKEGKTEEAYTYYIKDGEDERLKEYESQGYTVEKKEIKLVPDKDNNICLWVAQLFTFGILVSFIYPILWDKGYKDRNMVLTGNMAPDPLKGLKTGLIASLPAFALTLAFIFANLSPQVLKFLNGAYYPLIQFTANGVNQFSDLQLWRILLILLMLLIMPAIAFLGYYLGYKDISIGEKFIYNKQKKEV